MITTHILRAISERMISKKEVIAAKIKALRKAEGMPENQELPKELESHPVFTEEVFRILLKRKSEGRK